MKSKIVLFAFCLALLSGCGKKGFNMGGTPECAVETLQPTTVNLKSSYPATIKGKQNANKTILLFIPSLYSIFNDVHFVAKWFIVITLSGIGEN